MFNQIRWQSGTALVTAFGIASSTVLPLVIFAPVSASPLPYQVSQLFPSQRRSQANGTRIPAGTVIPVKYEKAEKVIVTPQETSPLTLTVSKNVRSTSGTLLIPFGSQVEGELRPAEGGSQFVAKKLTLPNGTSYDLDASSEVVTRKETIRKGSSTSSILKGAAIGAAAAAIIAEIFGGIDLKEVLIGAGAGALGGILLGRKSTEVVVIYPDTDLSLTLNSPLTIR
ncbi:MAG: hypothetical protein KME16_20845 [Scytolyngbya sp. HA4215-MV1]|jgi:energy-converting hydrogenase Eha subunit A|nr:hypothetical protein [Scytolyngbya sp. HA4215-MV1]